MIKNKILTMTITGGLILAFSFSSFAAESNTTNQNIRFGKNITMKMEKRMGFDRNFRNFEKWVEEGIITQEQADKCEEIIKVREEARKVEIEKIKDMTEEERRAYFEQNKTERKDVLSEFVQAGAITQEEADKIKESMPLKDEVKGRRGFADSISKWVEEEIITEEQADQIKELLSETRNK